MSIAAHSEVRSKLKKYASSSAFPFLHFVVIGTMLIMLGRAFSNPRVQSSLRTLREIALSVALFFGILRLPWETWRIRMCSQSIDCNMSYVTAGEV